MRPNGLRSMARAAGTAAMLFASLAAGCTNGDSEGQGGSDPESGARDLFIVDMDLDGLDAVPLNLPLSIEFSEFVSPESIRHDTILVRQGPNFGIQSPGEYKVSGNIVTFYPRLPSEGDLRDGGFKAGQQYRVTVAGHPKVNHVKAYTGRALTRTYVGSFKAAEATNPDLFTTDTYVDDPPPMVQFTNPPDVLPRAPWTTPGGAIGVPPKQIALQMVMTRVPLLPSTITSSNITLTMMSRKGVDFTPPRPVEADPNSPNNGIWVDQSFDGVTLYFMPRFPLPSESRFVLRIENRVTDLTGVYDVADNSRRAALREAVEDAMAKAPIDRSPEEQALINFAGEYPEEFDPRTFLVFQTGTKAVEDLVPPFELDFDGTDRDYLGGPGFDQDASTASFNDGVPGAVSAVFTAAGGDGTDGDFFPTANTTLNTNSGLAENGKFNFREIRIPTGVTVTILGTYPATLLSLKTATIDGVIGVSGIKGDDWVGSYQNTYLTPQRGGAGGPSGGKGGDCYGTDSGETNYYNTPGDNGQDGLNGGGKGGIAGRSPTSSSESYGTGSGGGGGGHREPGTAGSNSANTSGYTGWTAAGGAGGAAGGIQPSSLNTNSGKDFWNLGVGGGGGGSGGNGYYSAGYWKNSGAGGGGAGGALLVKSASDIKLSSTAKLFARGGNGGGANNGSGYPAMGGAGGGGAGGSIALYANGNLDITGAELDTSGGLGGASDTQSWAGRGGNGGSGYIQLEDADKVITGVSSAKLVSPTDNAYFVDKFDPTGTALDAPSVFTSTWFNVGVFEPILQEFQASHFTEQNFLGCTITYEMQMAVEDVNNFGTPNTTYVNDSDGSDDINYSSEWHTIKDPTTGIQDVRPYMNGHSYQFLRLRITFTLKDGQKRTDSVPFVDKIRIPFRY